MKVLHISKSGLPIDIISPERAFYKIFGGAVEVISSYDEKYYTPNKAYNIPCIVKNVRAFEPTYKNVPITSRHIFIRDGHKCVYCGSTKSLTLDHVVPKSKGGKDSWYNLVTACQKCNSIKDDKVLSELDGFTLPYPPFKPSYLMMMAKISGADMPESWRPYLWH